MYEFYAAPSLLSLTPASCRTLRNEPTHLLEAEALLAATGGQVLHGLVHADL